MLFLVLTINHIRRLSNKRCSIGIPVFFFEERGPKSVPFCRQTKSVHTIQENLGPNGTFQPCNLAQIESPRAQVPQPCSSTVLQKPTKARAPQRVWKTGSVSTSGPFSLSSPSPPPSRLGLAVSRPPTPPPDLRDLQRCRRAARRWMPRGSRSRRRRC
jgi:hypothetical protein